MKQIAAYVLLFFIVSTQLFSGHETKEEKAIPEILATSTWIRQKVDTYPELTWIKNSEGPSYKRPIFTNLSPSENVFGKKIDPFDDTIFSLQVLHVFFFGGEESYKCLIKNQEKSQVLTWESFQGIQNKLRSVIHSYPNLGEKEILQFLETSLILNQAAKTEIAKEKAKEQGFSHPDQFSFFKGVIEKCPQIFPSFSKLNAESQELMRKGVNLAHYGHICRLEGDAKMFAELKKSNILNTEPQLFELELFLRICDYADQYHEYLHQEVLALKEACLKLKNGDEVTAFEEMVKKRAEWMGLKPTIPIHRVITRVAAMTKCYKEADGKVLFQAFNHLSQEEKRLITEILGSLQQTKSKTPIYIPLLLDQLKENPLLGATTEERIIEMVKIGLPFIAKVCKEYQGQYPHGYPYPLDFSEVAKIAVQSPFDLQKKKYQIHRDGVVHLIDP